MTGDEFAQNLQNWKRDLVDEVISYYQQGNEKRGRFAFARWKERFTAFLHDYAPTEVNRFESAMRHSVLWGVVGEHPYHTFMREDGEDCIAFIDDLAHSALKGRIDLQRKAVVSPLSSQEEKSSLESPPSDQISVLFLAADPTNESRLRLGQEFREIDEQLTLAKGRAHFNLALPQLSLRPKDIARALLNAQPQIVHFSGHGTSEGELCFENEMGQVHLVQPDALAALFEQFANQVNCVVLNACYSEIQATAIAVHIDYVVGMNQAIGDEAAIAFAIGFYQALGAGRTIEEAYNLGCVQIQLQDLSEHLTPVLIKKGQALA